MPPDADAVAETRWANVSSLAQALDRARANVPEMDVRGRIVEATGILVKAAGVDVRMGELCELVCKDGRTVLAETVGFSRQGALLMPYDGVDGLSPGTEVVACGRPHRMGMSDELLGRVLDGFGRPMDGYPGPGHTREASCRGRPPDPLKRRLIDRALSTGVRAIDALLPLGEGQRMGIFAPAGVGKSTLLGMLARNTDADVNVIGLVGERGREVREFLEESLGGEALARSVCIIATSDRSAVERARAVHVATAVAEYFRDQGKRVLLMVDSLTRFARAQRDIGLACGEPPTRRAFTPSVFAELPLVLERAGQGERGSITAFYTVLMEDEDMSDPIAEEVRSILDGHIVLSRKLGARGHFPAIDVLGSVSRVMPAIADERQVAHAAHLRQLMAKYTDVELLVQIGEYKAGSDALADEAVQKHGYIAQFLTQGMHEHTPRDETLRRLADLAS
jgi:type III secretion protein N (ATPase)